MYSGVNKLGDKKWQPFVREYDKPEFVAYGQICTTRWQAAQLAQELHSRVAFQQRQERDKESKYSIRPWRPGLG